MWWPTHARAPLATQNVLLSSAPHASSGRVVDRQRQRVGHEPARAPHQQRAAARAPRAAPSRPCACGSGGRGAARASAIASSRSSASSSSCAIGSSETLPLVITSGSPASASSRWCSGEYGQQHAEVGRARRDRRRHRRVRPPRREHDRAVAAGEQRRLLVGQRDERARRLDVAHHDRERLVLAVLARPQRRDRRLARGQAGEVVAADALDRHDRALAQRGDRLAQRLVAVEVVRQQPQRRPALGARVGLGVEAPVGRVLVLGGAARAQLEARHRRQRPVVGDAAHDREARAAVGAVDERVAVAAVGGVEQLAQAVVAGRGVGRDERARLAAVRAGEDAEAALARGRDLARPHRLDRRERRRLLGEPAQEAVDRAVAALDLDEHAALVVEHEAREVELGREPVHERAEADPLHRPLAPGRRTPPHRPTSSQSTWYALAWASWIRGMCSERVTIDVVGEPVRRHPPAAVADAGDRHQPALARLDQRGDHAAASCRSSTARSARRPARRRRSPGARRSRRSRCRWRAR